MVQQCLRSLTLEQFDAEQVVFHKGEAGSKFYIIIQGTVGIFVADPKRGNRPSAIQVRTPLMLKKLSFMGVERGRMSYGEVISNLMKINEMSEG